MSTIPTTQKPPQPLAHGTLKQPDCQEKSSRDLIDLFRFAKSENGEEKDPSDKGVKNPSPFLRKILIAPVYRLATQDPIPKFLVATYATACSLKNGAYFRPFDPVRAQAAVDRFVALGANVYFVTPEDGKGKIQMMTFRPDDLKEKIEQLGGSWERRHFEGKEVLAIVPPKNQGADWQAFKKNLDHFHWTEVCDGETQLIITCFHADRIPEKCPNIWVMHTHSTSVSFSYEQKRLAYLLGAGINVCFYDNGNIWRNEGRSDGEPSFYKEALAVLKKMIAQNPSKMEEIWVTGSCGGSPMAALLKAIFHEEGINFACEQSFPTLDMFGAVPPWLASRLKGSLTDPEYIKQNPEESPLLCQFEVGKLWQGLPPYNKDRSGGKVLIVRAEGDEEISPEASAKYKETALKVAPRSKVHEICFKPKTSWAHAANFWESPQSARGFLNVVYSEARRKAVQREIEHPNRLPGQRSE